MRLRHTILIIAIGFTACKRDKQDAPEQQPVPEITAISREIVQSGDTLILTGKNLEVKGLSPEAFIGNRPTRVLKQTPETIELLVPEKVLTGNIVIQLGSHTAIWPEVKVAGTPAILTVSPLYVFPGDTLYLTGENLTGDPAALKVWLDGKAVEIPMLTGTSAKIIVPEGTAVRAALTWQAYGGKIYEREQQKITVRPSNIAASTILEYLEKDPGMDVTFLAMDYMSTNPVRKNLHDTLRQYLDGTTPCIMFLPNNEHMAAIGVNTREDVIRKNFPYAVMLSQVITHVSPLKLEVDQLYPCEYTHYIYSYDGGEPSLHGQLVIREKDGVKYVVATTNSASNQWISERGPWVKILKEHVCGNSILYETEAFLIEPYGIF